MSTVPVVSVAIRAYRRRWLGEAVASVLAQTYDDLELVVYDDAGDLEDVVAGFGDERVRYHRAQVRRGPAGRYKAAVGLCRGEYVGVLDDDDRYEPTFVARLLAALEADPTAGAAVTSIVWDDGAKLVEPPEPRRPGPQADAREAFLDLRSRWIVTPSAALLRRAALDDGERRHPMPDDVAPDTFVNVRAAVAGWRFVLVDSPLVVKRWHEDQISHGGFLAHDLAVATWRRLPLEDPALDRLRGWQLARSLVARAGCRLLENDPAGARADLRAARTAAPGSWRWRRRALTAASRLPRAGRAALRIRAVLPPTRRRRRPRGAVLGRAPCGARLHARESQGAVPP